MKRKILIGKPLILFPETLVIQGFFRGLKYRKLWVMIPLLGGVRRFSIPLYPTGFVKRRLMNVIDEALGRNK